MDPNLLKAVAHTLKGNAMFRERKSGQAILFVLAISIGNVSALGHSRGDGFSGGDTTGQAFAIETDHDVPEERLLAAEAQCYQEIEKDVLLQKVPQCRSSLHVITISDYFQRFPNIQPGSLVCPGVAYIRRDYSNFIIHLLPPAFREDEAVFGLVPGASGASVSLPYFAYDHAPNHTYNPLGDIVTARWLAQNIRVLSPLPPVETQKFRSIDCRDPHGMENGSCMAYVNTLKLVQCLRERGHGL
jgi:hypothetical protein